MHHFPCTTPPGASIRPDWGFGEIHGNRMESLHEPRRDFNYSCAETESRVEVTHEVEALTVRLGDMLSVARWTIGILTPIIVTLIGSAFALTWYVAKLDSRMERVDSSVFQKDASKLPPRPITPKTGR